MQPYIYQSFSRTTSCTLPAFIPPAKLLHLILLIITIAFSAKTYAGPAQPDLLPAAKPISIFLPDKYNSGPQNRKILQHPNGLIYVANNGGLLEFDGINWRKYPIPDYKVWSLALDSEGRLYIGGSYGRIGVMEPDSIGQLTYRSLHHDIELGAIYDITSVGDTLYFHTQYCLLQWDGSTVHTLIADSAQNLSQPHKERLEIFPGFKVNGKAVIRENRRQLKQIHTSGLRPMEYGLFERDLRVQSILPYRDKLLLATDKQGFWLYGKEELTNIHPALTVETRGWSIYDGVVLSDSTVAYATKTAGIIFFDPKRGIIDALDKNEGLPSNKCISITTDSEGNLWAAMEGAIVKIDYDLSATFMGPSAGLNGIVNSVIRFNGRMFAATSLGIYVLNEPTGNWMKPDDIAPEVAGKFAWKFLHTYNELMIATSDGLYLKSSEKKRIRKLEGLSSQKCYVLYRSRLDSNRVFVFGQKVVSSIYYRGGNWQVEKSPLAAIPGAVNTIGEDQSGRIWTASPLGVYTIAPQVLWSNSSSTAPISAQAKTSKVPITLPSSNAYAYVLTVGDSLYISNADSVFAVNPDNGSLKPSNSFQGIERVFNEKWTPFIEPESQTIWWFSKGRYLKSASISEKGNQYLASPLNSVTMLSLNSVYFDDDLIWFSTREGVVRYKTNRKRYTYPEKRPLLRRLEIIDGNTLRENLSNQLTTSLLSLPSTVNNLRFHVADASYLGNRQTEFQFKLSPLSANWTNWTTKTSREYTFLNHGSYTFSVRMKNDFDEISEPVHYTFEVQPPWYLHPFMYFIYALFLIFALIGTAVFARRRGFAKAEKKYLKREIQSAVETQRILIPENLPGIEGFSLAGYFEPAAEVGGDHYDAIPVDNGNAMLLTLADIEGKRMAGAVPATLLNGLLNGVIGHSVPYSLIEIALRVDSLFYTKLKGERRVALLMALLQKKCDTITLFNAGCYPPLHLKNGTVEELNSDDLKNAPLGNGMVERGLSSLTDLREYSVMLNAGESLILYSDGIRGLRDRNGRKFFPRLREELSMQFKDKNAPEIAEMMVQSIMDFVNTEGTQLDDITLLVIQRSSS